MKLRSNCIYDFGKSIEFNETFGVLYEWMFKVTDCMKERVNIEGNCK